MAQEHNPHIVDPAQDPYRTMTPEQMVNDPSVIHNPYAKHGIKMTALQKRKFKRQIRLQMQSKSWFQDKYQSILVQRNILALISVSSVFVAFFANWAVMSLAPRKSVEPFIIQIEEKSGITQTVEPLDRSQITGDEALDNYFLWAYTRARETYHPADQRQNWNITRIMSDPDIYAQYLQDISPNNPTSARSVLGGQGQRVLSSPTITYLSNNDTSGENRQVAQVRFVVEETFKKVKTRYPKIATIEFSYFELNLNRADRLINPLGFQVLSYRLDEEVVN